MNPYPTLLPETTPTRCDSAPADSGAVREYVTAEHLTEMRDWLADCVWADMQPDDFAEVSDDRILHGIQRHYDGGIRAFLTTCGL